MQLPSPANSSTGFTVRYCGRDHTRCDLIPPEQISDVLGVAGGLLWVDLRDPSPADLEVLKDEFGFHDLALEDVAKQMQRPKIDEYPGYFFVVAHAPLPPAADGGVETGEVDLFIGRNYVVTVSRGGVPAVNEAVRRWERTDPELRYQVGFLLHTVVDSIIDAYFPVVERIEDRLDALEVSLFSGTRINDPKQLLGLKRDLLTLRKSIYPLREVFNTFLRHDHQVFTRETLPYFQDLYDHVLRLLDVVDIQREAATATLDAQLAVASNQLNETMKRLTVLAICVALLGAVFGAWGMNFEHVPLDYLGVDGFIIVSLGTLALLGLVLVWTKIRRLW